MSKSKLVISRYFPAIWLILLIVYVLAGTPLTPFHGDEATQIFMSRDYAYLFIEHDLSKVEYSETSASPAEQELRLLNGVVNKYLIGLAWHISGLTINDLNEQWDWGAGWDYNLQNNHAPSPALLAAARWPSAVLLAAGVAIMFGLGRAVGGRWTPYLASLYYALNPALLLNGRRAMMEGSFIFFSLLVVLVGVWLVTRPSLARALLLGLVCGFALASKHTAIFTVATVLGTAVIFLIFQSVSSQDDYSDVEYLILPYLVITIVVTGLTFYVLNPAWWGEPAARAQKVLELRQNLLAGQSAAFVGYYDAGEQLIGFLRQGLVVLPQYFEVIGWEGYIGDQIAQYGASVWRGVSVGGSAAGAVALCVMMGAGTWRLVSTGVFRALWRFGRQKIEALVRRPDDAPEEEISLEAHFADEPPEESHEANHDNRVAARWIIGVWALAMILTTWVLTPLEWQRYYLPLYPAIGLVAAVGVNSILEGVLIPLWMKRRA
ncbi:MAG: phospholipid carrier-dependent glycosyltransferase [Anaerolineae bacterium]